MAHETAPELQHMPSSMRLALFPAGCACFHCVHTTSMHGAHHIVGGGASAYSRKVCRSLGHGNKKKGKKSAWPGIDRTKYAHTTDWLVANNCFAARLSRQQVAELRKKEARLRADDVSEASLIRRLRIALANKGKQAWNIGVACSQGAPTAAALANWVALQRQLRARLAQTLHPRLMYVAVSPQLCVKHKPMAT